MIDMLRGRMSDRYFGRAVQEIRQTLLGIVASDPVRTISLGLWYSAWLSTVPPREHVVVFTSLQEEDVFHKEIKSRTSRC